VIPRWLRELGNASADLPRDEVRRRRREAALIAVTAIAFVVFAIFQTRLPDFQDSSSQSGNIVFFLLINLNLILLVLLVFLVARNLTKLVLERRRRILGARLRTRLVLAFASLSLIPTVLLFLVAQGFFASVIENWFGLRVQTALTGALDVAHRYYQQAADETLVVGDRVAREIERRGLLAPARRAELNTLLSQERDLQRVDGIDVVSPAGPLATAHGERIAARGVPLPRGELRILFASGQDFARTERFGRGDVVVGGIPVRDPEGAPVAAVVVARAIPQDVALAARRTAKAVDEYRQLKVLKQPLRGGYTITFLLITLVVLFSATWFGFYFAKGITVPIQRLGEGMREVAQGNWDFRAQAGGDEEVATLVTSFNRMAGDLKTIHGELAERHRYIESILENITAGVISLDPSGAVATVNPAAANLLGLRPDQARGRSVADLFTRPDLQPLNELITRLGVEQRDRVEQQLTFDGGSRSVTAFATATALRDEQGAPLGVILFLEDVTYLLRVERMEAWREVARRIAHEIKNPLTPIQLSAQRMRKRYASTLQGEDAALLDECTRTISAQVEQLKRLVNEFSSFARLPTLEVAPQDLRAVVEEALVLYREGHREVTFAFDADAALPAVEIDRDAIKRAVINLLDNAVYACSGAEGGGRIAVSLVHDTRMGLVRLEVADNGPGMTPEVKARVFEPYFSTKKDGSGLGLAIVSAIVADHHAYIRVRDNQPRGVRVVIEFPLRQPDRLRAAVGA
jgi:two-component system nitrogen regulation sensor histidine kinase NtrY